MQICIQTLILVPCSKVLFGFYFIHGKPATPSFEVHHRHHPLYHDISPRLLPRKHVNYATQTTTFSVQTTQAVTLTQITHSLLPRTKLRYRRDHVI